MRNISRFWWIAPLAIGALLTANAYRGSNETTPQVAGEPEFVELEIGKRAPDFQLPAATGDAKQTVSLYDQKNKKAIVLMFIATRCPVSNDYNERMAAVAKAYAGKGVQFFGINSNRTEPASEIAEHAKSNGFTFPVLQDEGNRVADAYGARVTPEVYVLDSNMMLRYHGRIDDSQKPQAVQKNELREALDAVLAGRAPANARTKAFGCSIKRAQKG
jgi:peroxiredoxin